MDRLQLQLMLEALSRHGLTLDQVWVQYAGNGGRLGRAQLDLFLHSGAPASDFERDILAHTINELLWDREEGSSVPYLSPAIERQVAGGPDISAAAAWLLTDEEAELQRLRSLAATGLMQVTTVPVFDELVTEAQESFGVSAASVSLIGEHSQYFKAAVGPLRQHLPRREAFCDAAIRHAEPFVVLDTHTDRRFAQHPLVRREPYLRFYAAHPLRGPGGWNIGTFCILDQRPHAFTTDDRKRFHRFSRRAQREIGRFPARDTDHRTTSTGT